MSSNDILQLAVGLMLAAGCSSPADTKDDGGTSPTDGAADSSPEAMAGVDSCIVTATTSCRAATCHNTDTRASGLLLTTDALLRDYNASFVDKPNTGAPEVTMVGDIRGCIPGRYKLIDSTSAANSLIYMKAIPKGDPAQPPCGTKMPVVGMFTAADRACILSWIESVIAANGRR